MSPENLMIPVDQYYQYHHYHSMFPSGDHRQLIPVFGSEELGSRCSGVSLDHQSAASVNVQNQQTEGEGDGQEGSTVMIKAKIASHPSYPKLLDAYIDCQKVGAPPEMVYLLDEIRREKDMPGQDSVSMCLGVDPELDHFMENYCAILVKYKLDLSRPFDEATSFLNNIEAQLLDLRNGKSKKP
ncbi:Homeobox protein knotted-1-like 6 [Sesamum angolense]|uniref:Homeobox protein knotted-1-like 6 n=1 Tax=Sesamum angolense TaxID=2727404 RepID=A0AAE2BYV1_9LAMI|nr:Homeobox protein knotted-1-like 6 [Sesamum angolense]